MKVLMCRQVIFCGKEANPTAPEIRESPKQSTPKPDHRWILSAVDSRCAMRMLARIASAPRRVEAQLGPRPSEMP